MTAQNVTIPSHQKVAPPPRLMPLRMLRTRQTCRMCCKNQYKRACRSSRVYVKRLGCALKTNTNGMLRKHGPDRCVRHFGPGCAVKTNIQTPCRRKYRSHRRFRTSSAGCAVKTNTNGMSVFARLRQTSRTCHKKTNTNGMSFFARLRQTSRMCCNNQCRYVARKHRPHRRFRHFACRLATKNITPGTRLAPNTTLC